MGGTAQGIPDATMQEIGVLLAQITALLMVHEPNFLQGNPVVLVTRTDVKNVEIRTIISLGGKGIMVPRIARVEG